MRYLAFLAFIFSFVVIAVIVSDYSNSVDVNSNDVENYIEDLPNNATNIKKEGGGWITFDWNGHKFLYRRLWVSTDGTLVMIGVDDDTQKMLNEFIDEMIESNKDESKDTEKQNSI